MRNSKFFAALGAVGIAALIAGCSNAQAGEIAEATDLGSQGPAVSAVPDAGQPTQPTSKSKPLVTGNEPGKKVSAERTSVVTEVVTKHLLAVSGVEVLSVSVDTENPTVSMARAEIIHNGKRKTIALQVGLNKGEWDVADAVELAGAAHR